MDKQSATTIALGMALAVIPAACHAELGTGDVFFNTFFTVPPGELSFTFQSNESGVYGVDTQFVLGNFFSALIIKAVGDPFLEYTLRATNMSMEPGPLPPVMYSMGIDIQPTAGPDFLMRSTILYSVEDTDGNGMAELFAGQGSFLSDNRTNFINPPEMSIGGPLVSAPDQMHQADTGLLPLPDVPANFTTDTFGVMGIGGDFAVSSGDTAVITGRFEIVPAAQPLVGDYNRNGKVDAADYVVYRKTLGDMGAGLAADGNGNGQIDEGDYDVWSANFGVGETAGTAAATVPEPATLMLLGVSGVLLVLAWRGRPSHDHNKLIGGPRGSRGRVEE